MSRLVVRGGTLATMLVSSLLPVRAAWSQDSDPQAGDAFLRRFHLSGNADVAGLYGERNSPFPRANFKIDNARLFLDVDLAENLRIGGGVLVKDLSAYVEWDLVREASLENTIGSLYVRFDEIAGLEALHLKIGRFLVPFGEEYLRHSEAQPENPFLDFSAADPYGWDEGLLFFGPVLDGMVDYYASVTNGDFGFGANTRPALLFAGKLDLHPLAWMTLTGSVLYTGRSGSSSQPAVGAVEWSGSNPRSFGSATLVPNFQNGVPVADDPDPRLGGMFAWEADLLLRAASWGRLRLGIGAVTLRSADQQSYDRRLRYEIVEAILEARVLSQELDRMYGAVRYSRIGTGSRDRGYLLGDYGGGSPLGYNSRSLREVTLGLGYRLTSSVVLKVEYSMVEVRLVGGVSPSIASYGPSQNLAQVGVSIAF